LREKPRIWDTATPRRMMGAGRRRRTAALIMGRNAGNEKYTGGYGAGARSRATAQSLKVMELSFEGLRNFL